MSELNIAAEDGTPMEIVGLEWIEEHQVYKITARPVGGGPESYYGGTPEQVADVLEFFGGATK